MEFEQKFFNKFKILHLIFNSERINFYKLLGMKSLRSYACIPIFIQFKNTMVKYSNCIFHAYFFHTILIEKILKLWKMHFIVFLEAIFLVLIANSSTWYSMDILCTFYVSLKLSVSIFDKCIFFFKLIFLWCRFVKFCLLDFTFKFKNYISRNIYWKLCH